MSKNLLEEFRAGVVTLLPAAVAVIPFGLLLGARAAEKGLSTGEIFLMCATVFAGSAQFVVIDLWTSPASWAFIALTTLLVNIRHVLMGASLAGKLGAFPGASRLVVAFFMVDETWAMAERRALETQVTPAFYAGLTVMLYSNWLVCNMAGAAIGGAMTDPRALGFDFAFTAIFIGLLAGFWKGSTTAIVLAASAAAAVVVKLAVPGPWYIMAGGSAGVVAAVVAWKPSQDVEEQPA